MTDQTAPQKKLVDRIKEALENLVTLEIVTVVGTDYFKIEGRDKKTLIPDIDPSKTPKAIMTKIKLLQGDIQTFIHEDFIAGPFAELKQFHAEREKQGHEMIKSNIAALGALFDLADRIKPDQAS